MNVMLMFLERKLSLSVCCCIVLTLYAECTSVVSSAAIRYFHTEQSQPVCKTDLFTFWYNMDGTEHCSSNKTMFIIRENV